LNGYAGGIDESVSTLATELQKAVISGKAKRITVLDFTDLDGTVTKLGRLVSDDTTAALINTAEGQFQVIDRGNIKRILDEHNLASTGLVDPESARKLGKIAGVDAIIVGTITRLDDQFRISAKIINTESAQILGASKSVLDATEGTRELHNQMPHAASGSGVSSGGKAPNPKYPSQRLGPAKVTPIRLSLSNETSGAASINLINESDTKIKVYAGRPAAYSSQGLSGSMEFPSGGRLELREVRGFTRKETQGGYQRDLVQYVELAPREEVNVEFLFQKRYSNPAPGSENTLALSLELRIASEDGSLDVVRNYSAQGLAY